MSYTPFNEIPLRVSEENAPKYKLWLATRGGLAVWESRDLGGGPVSYTTPLKQDDGAPTAKPHWSVGDKPDVIITDPKDVAVEIPENVGFMKGASIWTATGQRNKRVRQILEKKRVQHGPDVWVDQTTEGVAFLKLKQCIPLPDYKC